MKYSFATDRGKKRSINQDCCTVFCPDEHSCFAIVCDGMGGAAAGEIASSMVVETVEERVKEGWRTGISDESVRNLLLTSITAANINVFDKSQAEIRYQGMGTTVVACVLMKDHAIFAHAGDSRAYLFSDRLKLITKDHSFVQELVDLGRITREQAKNHPRKNYITRALGVEELVEIDFNTVYLSQSDKILLCTDGLSNFVSEERIAELLSEQAEDPAAVLVAEANENGGGDNITAVVLSQN